MNLALFDVADERADEGLVGRGRFYDCEATSQSTRGGTAEQPGPSIAAFVRSPLCSSFGLSRSLTSCFV